MFQKEIVKQKQQQQQEEKRIAKVRKFFVFEKV